MQLKTKELGSKEETGPRPLARGRTGRDRKREIRFKMGLPLGASRGRQKGREDGKGWGIGLVRDGDLGLQRWKRR